MWLRSASFGIMFPLVALAAAQVNAEAECPSLLMLTRRSREDEIPFHDNKCGAGSLELFRKKVQDNTLTFNRTGNSTLDLSALSFQGYWYTVTEGQPVDPNCFTITDKTTLHFKAGRHGSTGVADVFMKGNSETTVIRTGGVLSRSTPKKLNFAFEGAATFEFSDANSGAVLSISQAIRIAQGHKDFFNNWWIGHDQCTESAGFALLCGPLLFLTAHTDAFLVYYLKREFHDGCCHAENYPSLPKPSQIRFLPFPFELQEGNYSIQSFSFEPSWYAVTAQQPVPTDCLQINQDGLTFLAGHSKSREARMAFMEHQTGKTILGVQDIPPATPKELYFALEGTASFTFERGENRSRELFRSSKAIRLGQGYIDGLLMTDWWLGNFFCRFEMIGGLPGLVCGDLFFMQTANNEGYFVAPLAWMY